MSKIEKFSIEQKSSQTNLLEQFKTRMANSSEVNLSVSFEKLNPEDPELYKKLKQISDKLPELPRWFWVMCGEKFQERNIKEVTKSLDI
jgi:hypothetical protein